MVLTLCAGSIQRNTSLLTWKRFFDAHVQGVANATGTTVQTNKLSKAMRMHAEVKQMSKLELRHTIIALAFLSSSGASAAAEIVRSQSSLPGKLLIRDGRGGAFETNLIDLASGKTQRMPRSELSLSQTSADLWTSSHPEGGGTLLRTDPLGNMAFMDARTMKVSAAIDLVPLRQHGLDPEFRSAIPSPDGKLLLGYWQPNYEGKPRLYVIARELKLIENGSPLRYRTDEASFAVDWLPDGRYVYLAGESLVVAKPGGGIISQTRLDIPAGVDPEGGFLKASPDGQHVLLTLYTRDDVPLGLLFSARIGDSKLQLLTQPSPKMLNGSVRLSMQSATWSPDGRWIAFVIRGVNPGAMGFYQSCQPVQVIPFNGAPHIVGGIDDEARYALRVPGEKKPLESCGTINWLP